MMRELEGSVLTVIFCTTKSGASSFVGLIIMEKGISKERRFPSVTYTMNWSAVGSILRCLDCT